MFGRKKKEEAQFNTMDDSRVTVYGVACSNCLNHTGRQIIDHTQVSVRRR